MSQFTFTQSAGGQRKDPLHVRSEAGKAGNGAIDVRGDILHTERRAQQLLTPQIMQTTVARRDQAGLDTARSTSLPHKPGQQTFMLSNRTEDHEVQPLATPLPQSRPNNNPNKKEAGKRKKKDPEPEETVYQTLYGTEDAAEQPDDRPAGPNQDQLQPNPQQLGTDRLSTSRASLVSDRVLRDFGSVNLNNLRDFGIQVERLADLFPLYFNEPVPQFNPKAYKQTLVLFVLSTFLESKVPLKQLITWTKTKDNKREAHLKLESFNESSKLSKLMSNLEEFPQEIIAACGVALHMFSVFVLKQPETFVTVRMVCSGSVMPVTSAQTLSVQQSSKINKFLLLTGRIITRMTPRLLVLNMPFKCQECAKEVTVHFHDGIFRQPSRCSDVDCLSKAFTMQKEKSQITVIQRFIIQGDGVSKDGHLMDQITCEARDTGINLLKLNKIGLLSGVWKTEPAARNFNAPKSVQLRGMYDHYLEVNNIEYEEELPMHQKLLQSAGKNPFKDSQREMLIASLVQCPLNFYILIANICPNVKGQELAKACVVLSLAGASNPTETNKNSIFPGDVSYVEKNFKNNIHLMLLGERGAGKSEILKFIESLSPQNNLFEGKGADLGRLTCTVVREANTEVMINPGLLPLSHGGVCCIDGMDKIDQIQNPIIEVIERRMLSVAKKGGFEQFECDTTIVASAEPKGNKLK